MSSSQDSALTPPTLEREALSPSLYVAAEDGLRPFARQQCPLPARAAQAAALHDDLQRTSTTTLSTTPCPLRQLQAILDTHVTSRTSRCSFHSYTSTSLRAIPSTSLCASIAMSPLADTFAQHPSITSTDYLMGPSPGRPLQTKHGEAKHHRRPRSHQGRGDPCQRRPKHEERRAFRFIIHRQQCYDN